MQMLAILLVLASRPEPSDTPQTNLKTLAMSNAGTAGSSVYLDFPLRSLGEMMSDADLVLQASVVSAEGVLNTRQTDVETEYTLQALQVLSARRSELSPKPGASKIVFRRVGGEMTLDGLRLSTQVDVYPVEAILRPGDKGIFFLKYDSTEKVYRLVDGPHGAFRVESETVRCLTPQVAELRKELPMPLGAFVANLARRR